MALIVNLACGLANRMFQYSFFLFLKKNGKKTTVDFYRDGKLAHEKVEWEHIFPMAVLPQCSKWKALWYGGGNNLFSRVRRRFIPQSTKVVQMPTAFDAFIPQHENAYVMGVFQNAKMVELVKKEVLAAFQFAPIEGERNKKLCDEMLQCESVGIHVRKGKDYQQRIWYQGTCSMEYYRAAIELMKKKLVHPRFYVFTDNPQWVKEYFKDFEYILVEGNPGSGWGSHFDMQLMSACKHNIISNSTYSWWGAFLNRNPQKIVVGPKQWFNPESCIESTSEQTLCKDWIAL